MHFYARIGKIALVATLMLSIGVCQVQGRKFFLSRIYQGVPTKDLSPLPGKQFSLSKAPPVIERFSIKISRPDRASNPFHNAVSASPGRISYTRLHDAPVPSFPLILTAERPTDRSPPL